MSSPIELTFNEAQEFLLEYYDKLKAIKTEFIGYYAYEEKKDSYVWLKLGVTETRLMFQIIWDSYQKTITVKSYAPNANFNISDKVDIKFVSKSDIKIYVGEIIRSVFNALHEANKILVDEFMRIDPKWRTYEKGR